MCMSNLLAIKEGIRFMATLKSYWTDRPTGDLISLLSFLKESRLKMKLVFTNAHPNSKFFLLTLPLSIAIKFLQN
jgi:hypothetical protein